MSVMQPLSLEPLHERAYNALRGALRSGRFRPGEAMTIRGLGKELGISATPVREALQRLIAAQALQLLPNRTIIVPVLTRGRFEEITKIRVRLEGLAAQEAAGRMSPADMRVLEDHTSEMETALAERRFNDYLSHNERFHFAIYEAADMPYLRQMIELSWLQTGPWLNMLASEGRFREIANSIHDEIIRGLVARDPDATREAVQRDILEAARHLAHFLPE
ncbi:MAG: GntR family transcriptional regulator [Rhodospirillaceae bacterium]|nr:MAG: GntR family transcriptional regulator [Rhodospirillaceae bacterium]